jgi:hypothetical protein
MKLTIIAEDGQINVNGVFYQDLDVSQLDPSIHAVQWYGEYGEVEYVTKFVDGAIVKPANKFITNMDEFSWALPLHEAARLVEQQALADAEAQRIIDERDVGQIPVANP